MRARRGWGAASGLAACLAGWAVVRAQPTPASALETLSAGDRIVMVQFRSERCAACAGQDDAVARISRDRTSWVPAVVQASFERDRDLRERYQVDAPGTILLLRGSRELARASNLQTEDQIREFIGVWASKARGRPRARARRAPRPKA